MKPSKHLSLNLHEYSLFPYERHLAELEVAKLVGERFTTDKNRVTVLPEWNESNLWRLTYFSTFQNGTGPHETLQHKLERSHSAAVGRSHGRQSTRYSVHGLHDYKGKFNPQLAHALLNIFGATKRSRILDPFCGSGTTLVEASHLGIAGNGFDMNPLAVFLANAKLRALHADVAVLRENLSKIATELKKKQPRLDAHCPRQAYLSKWFTEPILLDLERLRRAILSICSDSQPFFLSVASDLLREWSLQEPADLRIRRRKSPLPSTHFYDAWRKLVEERISILESVQPLLPSEPTDSEAYLVDTRDETATRIRKRYDFVITSPPYATALPYIDTQRLSLVWLGLISPDEIRKLEAGVLGSREVISGQAEIREALFDNASGLPDEAFKFCKKLADAVGPGDGFRRKAVPSLLYRYLAGMKATFSNLHKLVREGGSMAWVVGVNQTTLGGTPIVVNTPELLSIVATSVGFHADKPITLQTYQRYGLHQKNSIRQESALIFRR